MMISVDTSMNLTQEQIDLFAKEAWDIVLYPCKEMAIETTQKIFDEIWLDKDLSVVQRYARLYRVNRVIEYLEGMK